MCSIEAAMLATMIGSTAQMAYTSKRQHDVARKQEAAARDAKEEAKASERAKAQLMKQGVQEEATQVYDKQSMESGGVPLTIKKRLTIGSGAGANV